MDPIAIAEYDEEVQDLVGLPACFRGVVIEMLQKVYCTYGLDFEDPPQCLVVLTLSGFEAPIRKILDMIMESSSRRSLVKNSMTNTYSARPMIRKR
ncbi:hypothetical protein FGG08_001096 [Glutinoglossum americanum]|uniref:Uncharacterized protein n=1 Tax=Glutinoglossum americanum TaxID=1670608 RepID=A0A9P8I7G4_9PEZI|nr:hypothetical protein FGG08_001096 [Glutinoglossum americanum]